MRVLFIIDNLGGGGAQKLICDLVQHMQDEDCEMLLLSNRSDKYCTLLKEEGIPIQVIPETCKSFSSKLKYMWKVIKAGEYSVIHANLFPAIYYVAFIKRLHGKKCPPILMTEHSTDNSRRHRGYFRPIEKIIYGSYDHIISISKETQDALLKWLGINADTRFSIIENGINLEKYKNARGYRKEAIFSEYKNGDRLLGMIGSFTPQKNHNTMIKAMEYLPNKYKLILVGEGPLIKDIKKLVNEKNLDSRIVFLGFRKDVAEIMKTVDIVCVPSVWEGFGLVAVEAMAAGTPVVASEVPGLSDVVGDYGEKVDPRNAESIAKAIMHLEKKNEIAEASNDNTAKIRKYSIEEMKERYGQLFSEIAYTRNGERI